MGWMNKQGEADYPFSKDIVFEAVCQAIASIGHMRIDTTNEAIGQIVVRTNVNLLNFGERIPIQISEVDESKTKVQVTSSPKGGIWLAGPFDFGRNKKNIDLILSATSSILSSRKPALQKVEARNDDVITDSVADELKKLKNLMDEGILTKEEFNEQKAKLLN